MNRDLAIAVAEIGQKGLSPGQLKMALDQLNIALKEYGDDLKAWELKGRTLMVLHREKESLAAFKSLLARAPQWEIGVVGAARLSQELDMLEPALDYWKQALKLNPWMPDYHANLSLLLSHKGDWAGALQESRTWLQLDPGNPHGRKQLVHCLIKTGQVKEARAEFRKLERLHPSEMGKLRAWFEKEIKP